MLICRDCGEFSDTIICGNCWDWRSWEYVGRPNEESDTIDDLFTDEEAREAENRVTGHWRR